ncbi:2299_t:CDS:1, partial [Gigaspora margarita]
MSELSVSEQQPSNIQSNSVNSVVPSETTPNLDTQAVANLEKGISDAPELNKSNSIPQHNRKFCGVNSDGYLTRAFVCAIIIIFIPILLFDIGYGIYNVREFAHEVYGHKSHSLGRIITVVLFSIIMPFILCVGGCTLIGKGCTGVAIFCTFSYLITFFTIAILTL